MDPNAIRAAAAALEGRVVRTPLVHAPALGEQVWIKAELFQRSGSFKLRGALNKLDSLTADERAAGVATVSAGNHARALAYACQLADVRLTVFMWESASAYKIAATRALGATVDLSSSDQGDAFATMRAYVAETGATVVHPYDDPLIVAGAGTVGLEIVADLPGVRAVVVPVGGGGLVSGVAVAVKAHDPGVRVIAVEPELAPTLSTALQRGEPAALPPARTAADALAPPSVGAVNYAILSELADDVVVLGEAELTEGLRVAYADAKLACEVGGAAAIAALAAGRLELDGPTVLVASGGNVARDALVSQL